jgi:hypothetical protein
VAECQWPSAPRHWDRGAVGVPPFVDPFVRKAWSLEVETAKLKSTLLFATKPSDLW